MFKTITFCGNCFDNRNFLGTVGAPQLHWAHAISLKQTNKKNQKVDLNFMYNLLNNVQVSPLPAKRGLFKKNYMTN